MILLCLASLFLSLFLWLFTFFVFYLLALILALSFYLSLFTLFYFFSNEQFWVMTVGCFFITLIKGKPVASRECFHLTLL